MGSIKVVEERDLSSQVGLCLCIDVDVMARVQHAHHQVKAPEERPLQLHHLGCKGEHTNKGLEPLKCCGSHRGQVHELGQGLLLLILW